MEHADFLPPGLALIFDMDGVIVDSMPVHTLAWERYMESLGLPCDNIAVRMHGRRNDEIVAEFIGTHLPAEEVFRHGAAKEALYRDLIRPEIDSRLVPGVIEFIKRYAGAPLAVASNAEPANVEFILDAAGLRRFFRALVDGMQVDRPKPEPDVYLRAAELLGVEPGNCIIFEDSPAGVTAARAAGGRVVGVETHAPLEGVDFRIRDFTNPALPEWLRTQEPLTRPKLES